MIHQWSCNIKVNEPEWRERYVPTAESALLQHVPDGAKIVPLESNLPGCEEVTILPSGVRIVVAMGMSDDRTDWVRRGRCDVAYED